MGKKFKTNPKKVSGKKRLNLLWISRDYDTDPTKFYPVFLFTPDMQKPDTHYHIPMTKAQAKSLKKWLSVYLKERK